jgi:hypothetical protein
MTEYRLVLSDDAPIIYAPSKAPPPGLQDFLTNYLGGELNDNSWYFEDQLEAHLAFHKALGWIKVNSNFYDLQDDNDVLFITVFPREYVYKLGQRGDEIFGVGGPVLLQVQELLTSEGGRFTADGTWMYDSVELAESTMQTIRDYLRENGIWCTTDANVITYSLVPPGNPEPEKPNQKKLSKSKGMSKKQLKLEADGNVVYRTRPNRGAYPEVVINTFFSLGGKKLDDGKGYIFKTAATAKQAAKLGMKAYAEGAQALAGEPGFQRSAVPGGGKQSQENYEALSPKKGIKSPKGSKVKKPSKPIATSAKKKAPAAKKKAPAKKKASAKSKGPRGPRSATQTATVGGIEFVESSGRIPKKSIKDFFHNQGFRIGQHPLDILYQSQDIAAIRAARLIAAVDGQAEKNGDLVPKKNPVRTVLLRHAVAATRAVEECEKWNMGQDGIKGKSTSGKRPANDEIRNPKQYNLYRGDYQVKGWGKKGRKVRGAPRRPKAQKTLEDIEISWSSSDEGEGVDVV